MRKRFAALFKRQQQSSADIAKKRLQIIISADKSSNDNVMAQFKRELLDVISRNFNVDIADIEESVQVDMEQVDGKSTLELNITLPSREHLLA